MAAALDSSRPVRWGVLGAGRIAATVGADIAASPASEIVAVASRDAGRAAAFARRADVPRSYGKYAELVADPDVDVVYVATTHAQHHEHALLALRAGKPVLVEKAFMLTARQARDVAAESQRSGLFCMEAMWTRFDPLIRTAQELVSAGTIGDLVGVRAELSADFPYDPTSRYYDLAAGGGALLDMGVYPTTVAWLFLGAPRTVQAVGMLAPTGADATAAMQWGYPDGRFAQVACSMRGYSPLTALVTGTDGWLRVEGRVHRPTGVTVHSGDDEWVIAAQDEPHPYRHEIAEVERCLRSGETESPVVPLAETIAILEVLDQARGQIGVRYPADDSPDAPADDLPDHLRYPHGG